MVFRMMLWQGRRVFDSVGFVDDGDHRGRDYRTVMDIYGSQTPIFESWEAPNLGTAGKNGSYGPRIGCQSNMGSLIFEIELPHLTTGRHG